MTTGVIGPLFFEPSPKCGSDYSDRIAGKTILVGASVCLYFGPVIAAIAMVANLTFSYFLEDRHHASWFASNLLVKEMKETFPFFFLVLKIQLVAAIIYKLMKWGVFASHQVFGQMLLVANFWQVMLLLFLATVVAPIVEEIVFRGFLQEKIQDVQTLLLGDGAKSTMSKVIRVGLQAIAFSALHFHPLQGIYNIPILLLTFLFGSYMGMKKESRGTLWTPMMYHGFGNAMVSFRTLLTR